MKLVAATIQDYRSITKAYKVPLGRLTVLIGPNNEGKSNVIRALVVTMGLLKLAARFGPEYGRIYRRSRRSTWSEADDDYEWTRDYPIQLQAKDQPGTTKVTLEFALEPKELKEFREVTGSQLKSNLALRVEFGPKDEKISVLKQGPAGKALTKKSYIVAEFVTKRIDFEHISAIRTAKSAQQVVETLVARELRELEDNPKFKAALDQIAAIQKPVLDRVSESITSTLRRFQSSIKNVEVQIPEERRFSALRLSCEVFVDDGLRTHLQQKGDGVQSLAALALMRHASEHTSSGRQLFVAIEEPESHLHPKAVHEVKAVIEDLSKLHQVVITSHSPIFVDRENIGNNVIVSGNRARPASSISELREILGVKVSDNLVHASVVLVVEGEDDRRSLKPLLSEHSQKLRTAISNNTLAIEVLGGGTNLGYKIGSIKQGFCLAHCFLDDDEAGRTAFARASKENLVDISEVTFANRQGQNDSEFEDWLEYKFVAQVIQSNFDVDLDSALYLKLKGKFSQKMRLAFGKNGKPWSETIKNGVKGKLCEAIEASPQAALSATGRSSLGNLIRALESKLDKTASR